MTQDEVLEVIEQLQNKHNNVKVVSGVIMGVMMILYFFSYATLVDKGLNGLLYFEIITTILFMLALIKLNRFAYLILRLRFGTKSPYRSLMNNITAENIGNKATDLYQLVQPQDQPVTES